MSMAPLSVTDKLAMTEYMEASEPSPCPKGKSKLILLKSTG